MLTKIKNILIDETEDWRKGRLIKLAGTLDDGYAEHIRWVADHEGNLQVGVDTTRLRWEHPEFLLNFVLHLRAAWDLRGEHGSQVNCFDSNSLEIHPDQEILELAAVQRVCDQTLGMQHRIRQHISSVLTPSAALTAAAKG